MKSAGRPFQGRRESVMKMLFLTTLVTLAIAAGTARAQEPVAHEHEHAQPPVVAEQKAPDADAATPERKEMMCACCKGGDAAMKDKMQDKMKKMMKDTK
jgi:hypothetical protein